SLQSCSSPSNDAPVSSYLPFGVICQEWLSPAAIVACDSSTAPPRRSSSASPSIVVTTSTLTVTGVRATTTLSNATGAPAVMLMSPNAGAVPDQSARSRSPSSSLVYESTGLLLAVTETVSPLTSMRNSRGLWSNWYSALASSTFAPAPSR